MPAGDMDPEYSIGVTNRFGGIDNDMNEDPFELIRAAQEKPKKEKDLKTKGNKKDVKPSAKDSKPPAKDSKPPAKESKPPAKDSKPPAKDSKPPTKDDKVPAKVTKDKQVKTEPPPQSPTEGNKDSSDRSRGRGRGRGRGGERGRGRGFQNQNEDGDNQPPRPRGGTCHRCGEGGHFIRDCPQPKTLAVSTSTNDGGISIPSGGFGSHTEGFGAPTSLGFGNEGDDEPRGGRGGFRGGRGRGRGGRGGGREFDRRSGSDKSSSVKPVDKRDGSGSFNWGTLQDELDASNEPQGVLAVPKEDEPVAETEETQEKGVVSSEETENKENAEPEQMSFEEYKRKQQESLSKVQHNIRKANEGEKLKGVKQLKKPTEEENEEDGSLFFPKKYVEEKYKTSGRVKEHMSLDFQFAAGENRHMDQSRRGVGRGRGRGGRGGRGRDDQSGGFGTSAHIQLENAEEFPSLA